MPSPSGSWAGPFSPSAKSNVAIQAAKPVCAGAEGRTTMPNGLFSPLTSVVKVVSPALAIWILPPVRSTQTIWLLSSVRAMPSGVSRPSSI